MKNLASIVTLFLQFYRKNGIHTTKMDNISSNFSFIAYLLTAILFFHKTYTPF